MLLVMWLNKAENYSLNIITVDIRERIQILLFVIIK
jgi:hypothetical protein